MSEVKELKIGQKWVAPHGTVFKVLGDICDGVARVKVSSLSDEDRARYGIRFNEPGGNVILKFRLHTGAGSDSNAVGGLTLKEDVPKKTLWIADDGCIVESQGKVRKPDDGTASANVVCVERGSKLDITPGAVSGCFSLYGLGCTVQFRKMKRAEIVERKLAAAHREIDSLKRALHDMSRIATEAGERCNAYADNFLVPSGK